MFSFLAPAQCAALSVSLAARGVDGVQFDQAQKLAKGMGERLARAYGDALGRPVEPLDFVRDVLGVEASGRLLVCALREVAGRPDLYRDAF
ncbi:hypothetical protein QCN29_11540 [Streptomyces sp. HNM0663]|uniref:Uncharacterized protein n=1 Tax=Streptomyces chengmaiensis TaxID=3040919 RepID=A0ABT6HL09_9ACTN|nr:hypothetical protein [Streptomyces chengmaiensis]MDH2389415.1 hypothetical protein [Streptomyces chengmaiensis]